MRAKLRAAEIVLWCLGAALAGYFVWDHVERTAYQRSQKRAFGNVVRHAPEVGPPAVQSVPVGGTVGRVRIPRAGLDAVIVNGTTEECLRRAVGHIEGPPLPGGGGNVGLAAHRDTFFRGLGKLRRGDRIEVETPQGEHEYTVESMRVVTPSDTWVLEASARPTLTLVTCDPFHYVGPAPLRYIVEAREVAASDHGRLEALQLRR